MKILYLDCSMGAAGDMLAAALLELHPDPDGFLRRLNSLVPEGVEITGERSVKCGIAGTHVSVTVRGAEEDEYIHDGNHAHTHAHERHNHEHAHAHSHGGEHHHTTPGDIEKTVSGMDLPPLVREDIISVYNLIAEAESSAHGTDISQIHFHEVGTLDAVADITAVCMLMRELSPDRVIVSPVHVGYGQVKCAHGILPVPAPATAHILKDVPIIGGDIEGELCTPTGAALIRRFADGFGSIPLMCPEKTGYGMGKKDFPAANCVRAVLGTCPGKIAGDDADSISSSEMSRAGGRFQDGIYELTFNIDDMSGEDISFACDILRENGAREVYAVPVYMKKSRPGTQITVLCDDDKRSDMAALIFRHTSTIGIRGHEVGRYVLDRRFESLKTQYGTVSRKISSGYGVERSKYEFGDLESIARKYDMSIEQLRKLLSEIE